MKFVFHVGPDDVFNLIVSVIIIGILLVFAILVGYETLKTKFKRWRMNKKKMKEGNEKTGGRNT